MKKSRFSEGQIIGILKKAEPGVKTADLCREDEIIATTVYQWKRKSRCLLAHGELMNWRGKSRGMVIGGCMR